MLNPVTQGYLYVLKITRGALNVRPKKLGDIKTSPHYFSVTCALAFTCMSLSLLAKVKYSAKVRTFLITKTL